MDDRSPAPTHPTPVATTPLDTATDIVVKDQNTGHLLTPIDGVAKSPVVDTLASPKSLAIPDSNSSQTNGEAVNKQQEYEDDNHHASTPCKDITPAQSTQDPRRRITSTDTSYNPSPFDTPQKIKSEPQNFSTIKAGSQEGAENDHTVNCEAYEARTASARSKESSDRLMKEEASDSYPLKSIEVNGSSTLDSDDSSSSLNVLQASTKDAHTANRQELSQDEKKPFHLLHFDDDDPTQYNGDALWKCMLDRCAEWSRERISKKAAMWMSLQGLRRGKCDAEAVFKRLCDISENDKDFCLETRSVLGLLQHYRGGSILEAPFNTFPKSARVFVERPGDSCLTCIKKGRSCHGATLIESRCLECHYDKMNENAETEVDECYWEQPLLGISTWSHAEDLYGSSEDNATNSKRKAAEHDVKPGTKKRGRQKKTNINTNTNSTSSVLKTRKPKSKLVRTRWGDLPEHLPIPCLNKHEPDLLPELTFKLFIRVIPSFNAKSDSYETVAGVSSFKSIKAVLVYRTWMRIRELRCAPKLTDFPRHEFGIRESESSEEMSLTEEDLVYFDRQLRAGQLDCFKQQGFAFICTARPGL